MAGNVISETTLEGQCQGDSVVSESGLYIYATHNTASSGMFSVVVAMSATVVFSDANMDVLYSPPGIFQGPDGGNYEGGEQNQNDVVLWATTSVVAGASPATFAFQLPPDGLVENAQVVQLRQVGWMTSAPPAVTNGGFTKYFSAPNRFFAWTGEPGSQDGRFDGPASASRTFPTGTIQTESQRAPLALSSDNERPMLYGSTGSNLFVAMMYDLGMKWEIETNSEVVAEAVVSPEDSVVYYAEENGYVHAVYATSGEEIWNATSSSFSILANFAQSADGTALYVGDVNGNIAKWTVATVVEPPSASPSVSVAPTDTEMPTALAEAGADPEAIAVQLSAGNSPASFASMFFIGFGSVVGLSCCLCCCYAALCGRRGRRAHQRGNDKEIDIMMADDKMDGALEKPFIANRGFDVGGPAVPEDLPRRGSNHSFDMGDAGQGFGTDMPPPKQDWTWNPLRRQSKLSTASEGPREELPTEERRSRSWHPFLQRKRSVQTPDLPPTPSATTASEQGSHRFEGIGYDQEEFKTEEDDHYDEVDFVGDTTGNTTGDNIPGTIKLADPGPSMMSSIAYEGEPPAAALAGAAVAGVLNGAANSRSGESVSTAGGSRNVEVGNDYSVSSAGDSRNVEVGNDYSVSSAGDSRNVEIVNHYSVSSAGDSRNVEIVNHYSVSSTDDSRNGDMGNRYIRPLGFDSRRSHSTPSTTQRYSNAPSSAVDSGVESASLGQAW